MAKSPHFAEVLTLGEALVAKLDDDGRGDTLSIWMAHHVAECIHAAKTGNASTKAACARAILDLWEHRHALPDTARPFAKLDNVLRTIEALDPSSKSAFYFRDIQAAAEAETNPGAQRWLTAAATFDSAARELITYCLGAATDSVGDDARKWVRLARASGLTAPEEIIVRFLTTTAAAIEEPSPEDLRGKRLQALLTHLEVMAHAARTLKTQLSAQLTKKVSAPKKRRTAKHATSRNSRKGHR